MARMIPRDSAQNLCTVTRKHAISLAVTWSVVVLVYYCSACRFIRSKYKITANYRKKRHTFHLDASGQYAGPASRPVGPKAEVSPHRRISHHFTVIYSAIQGKRFFGLFELTRQKKKRAEL